MWIVVILQMKLGWLWVSHKIEIQDTNWMGGGSLSSFNTFTYARQLMPNFL
jgi:hypothetical protein